MAKATPKRLDDTLLALSDNTRREILRKLTQGEQRVTDLAERFPISLNSVSKHIRILERAGLVHRRRAGREHFLSFEPRPLDEAALWMDRQREQWAQLAVEDAKKSKNKAKR